MSGTPVERITLRITADPRLARVVRTAVLWEGRAWGMSAAQAAPLASDVARRFREIAGRSNSRPRGTVHLSIEPGSEEFIARLAPGGGRDVWMFRARRRKGRSRSKGRESAVRE